MLGWMDPPRSGRVHSALDLRSIRRPAGCGRAGEADLIGDSHRCGCIDTEASLAGPASTLTPGQEATMIVGIDVHKRTHAVALLDERGGEVATTAVANSPEGFRRLIGWLSDHEAGEAVVGVESPGSYGRCLVGALAAAGHEVLHVPAWRTHRERHRQDPARPTPETPSRSPRWCCESARSSVRRSSRSWFELCPPSSCSAVASSATARRPSNACAPTGPRSTRSPRDASCAWTATASCAASSGSPSATGWPSRPRPLHPRARPRRRGPQPPDRRPRRRDRSAARRAREPARGPARGGHQPRRHGHRPGRRRSAL